MSQGRRVVIDVDRLFSCSVSCLPTWAAEHSLPDPPQGALTKFDFNSRLASLRNGDVAPSLASLIKGSRTAGEVALQSCFRSAPDASLDARAMLFFVNDLCGLTIDASRSLVGALAQGIDGSLRWAAPQLAVLSGSSGVKAMPEAHELGLVATLSLRAAVAVQTADLGQRVLLSGVIAAALTDLETSNVSPQAASITWSIRQALSDRSRGGPPALYKAMAGYVGRLAELACWLEAFDPATTLAMPARSVAEGAWCLRDSDEAFGKILALPGSCGYAGDAIRAVVYAPVGPVLVRRAAVPGAQTVARATDAGGIGVGPQCFIEQGALQREWDSQGGSMGAFPVLPVTK